MSVPIPCSMTAVYSTLPNIPSQLDAKLLPLAIRFEMYSSVAVLRNCPTIVSGPMLSARMALGYKLLMSREPIQSCIPSLGYATYAPAAAVSSRSSFLIRLGTTQPLRCASLIMACSVTATAPIVVCSNTVHSCASVLAISRNFNFLSSLSSSAQSCLLYSMNVLKSLLYN